MAKIEAGKETPLRQPRLALKNFTFFEKNGAPPEAAAHAKIIQKSTLLQVLQKCTKMCCLQNFKDLRKTLFETFLEFLPFTRPFHANLHPIGFLVPMVLEQAFFTENLCYFLIAFS